MDMRDRVFGDRVFDKHTYSAAFRGLVQIMRQTISNLDMGDIPKPSYASYHGYKGLSSIPQFGGGGVYKTYLDTKPYIYKHYMFDMRDIKVWQI